MATQKAVAEHLDLSDRQVRNHIEEHVLPGSQPGSGMDLDECRILYIRYLRELSSGQRNRPAGDYDQERTRLTRAQADKTELEVSELRGNLIRVPLVTDHWQTKVSSCRSKLLSMPSKLAASIAPPDKLAEVQDKAQSYVYEALAELAGDGIPDDVRDRIAAINRSTGRSDFPASAEADSEPVGGGKTSPKPRGQRGSRKVSAK